MWAPWRSDSKATDRRPAMILPTAQVSVKETWVGCTIRKGPYVGDTDQPSLQECSWRWFTRPSDRCRPTEGDQVIGTVRIMKLVLYWNPYYIRDTTWLHRFTNKDKTLGRHLVTASLQKVQGGVADNVHRTKSLNDNVLDYSRKRIGCWNSVKKHDVNKTFCEGESSQRTFHYV